MRNLKFVELGITASETAWRALGAVLTDDGIDWDKFPVCIRQQELRELFHCATQHAPMFICENTTEYGGYLIGWVIAERQRRAEERTRATAESRKAESILALAESINTLAARS